MEGIFFEIPNWSVFVDNVRNYMGYLWIQKEGDIYTIGLNEEVFEDFDKIITVDLPSENEEVESEVVIGTIETDEGPIDIYSPVSGTVVEINQAGVEDFSIITEDPSSEGWLIKIESTEDFEEEDFDEDEDEEDEDDDFDEDEEDEEAEEDEED
jgi:glycine cleavage system H protein